MNLEQLLIKKQELESQLLVVNKLIELEESKKNEEVEKPVVKKIKKSEIFFKAGEIYPVFMRTQGLREFKCTEINLAESIVKGSYNGGEIKLYKAEAVWDSIADRNNGKAPSTFAIIVDKRSKTQCISKK